LIIDLVLAKTFVSSIFWAFPMTYTPKTWFLKCEMCILTWKWFVKGNKGQIYTYD